MKILRRQGFLVAGCAALVLILTPALALAGDSDTHWFVSFTRIPLPLVDRIDTSQLVEAGRLETDGFTELVFNLGGEFKEAIPSHGAVGAVLIPDIEVFQYLFRDEGQFVFPLEVKIDVSTMDGAIFISEQQTVKVAFPAYRVFLYNETDSGAMASFYVYRTR